MPRLLKKTQVTCSFPQKVSSQKSKPGANVALESPTSGPNPIPSFTTGCHFSVAEPLPYAYFATTWQRRSTWRNKSATSFQLRRCCISWWLGSCPDKMSWNTVFTTPEERFDWTRDSPDPNPNEIFGHGEEAPAPKWALLSAGGGERDPVVLWHP